MRGFRAKRHYRRALVLTGQKDWPAAANAFESALAKDDSKADWHYRLGRARVRVQDWPGAANAFDAALARDDSNADWHYRLGLSLVGMKDWQAAADAFEAALARDDSNADWHRRLSLTRAQLQTWDEAIVAYEAAIARDDTNARWHLGLGALRVRKKEWRAAAAAYQAAIARDNGNPDWYYRLGIVLAKLRDWQGAAHAYGASLGLDPTNDKCRSLYGNYLALDGDETGARAVLAPFVTDCDARLEEFVSFAPPRSVERKVVGLPRSSGAVIAREIIVHSDQQTSRYFELLKEDCALSRRLSAFYASLEKALGDDIPDPIPRLCHSAICDRYRYFLYEYRDGVSGLLHGHPADVSDLDRELGARVVECLVETSGRLQCVFDRSVRAEGVVGRVLDADIRDHLEAEAKRMQHDASYCASLRSLSNQWSRHAARLADVDHVMSHGDVHGGNLIASADGRISLVDWDSYGWAPAGSDLVTAYRYESDCPAFETLLDQYFDGLAPQIGPDERRYVVALLAILSSCDLGTPLPEKWLGYLT